MHAEKKKKFTTSAMSFNDDRSGMGDIETFLKLFFTSKREG
jgi:hypothetical protein